MATLTRSAMWSLLGGMADSPQSDIVYFDLETQRSAGDVGGWGHRAKMGMSIGVTFSTRLGEYRIFGKDDTDALIDQLVGADLVVGFNHVGFDYQVLHGYTVMDLVSRTVNLDLLLDIEKSLGHRVKLEDVALASLGLGKIAEGLQAIQWWREGKIREIAEYCAFDVKVTMRVHEFGRRHGHVLFHDHSGQAQKIAVDW
jgi:DEAD/DEAH box helicase domain-containing protein